MYIKLYVKLSFMTRNAYNLNEQDYPKLFYLYTNKLIQNYIEKVTKNCIFLASLQTKKLAAT